MTYTLVTLLLAMNLSTAPLRSKRFTNANGSSKEGDSAWQPAGRARDGWPGQRHYRDEYITGNRESFMATSLIISEIFDFVTR